MKTSPIRWGILGTGNIAKTFARDLALVPDARLTAVGSRNGKTAESFAQEFQCRAHDSYEALCQNSEVDVIYVASPHNAHCEHALMAIAAGKSVLVEKPFALNRIQAEKIVAAAQKNKVFCMEAMWTRFLPAQRQVAVWLSEKAIGEIHSITADFGFQCARDPASRLLDPKLAGGALLDVGVYPIAMAMSVMGKMPSTIQASAVIGSTGVDEQTAVTLGWQSGTQAQLSCSIRTNTRHEAVIYGASGRIEIPKFWQAHQAILTIQNQDPVIAKLPPHGKGYTHEISEVCHCLQEGHLESELLPLNESLEIIQILDVCRKQMGLVYPDEFSK